MNYFKLKFFLLIYQYSIIFDQFHSMLFTEIASQTLEYGFQNSYRV